MSSYLGQWYELAIIPRKKELKSKTVVLQAGDGRDFNGYGRYGYEAGWRYQKLDVKQKPSLMTIFRRAKNSDSAKKMGSRKGTVVSCFKVSAHFHYEKIEYLNLKQAPLSVSIVHEDEFILNANGELTPTLKATRSELEKKYEINIDLSD